MVAFIPGSFSLLILINVISAKTSASKCFSLWIINYHYYYQNNKCMPLSLSVWLFLGCITSRSLPLLGGGPSPSQSGISNLRAVGPCQGAATTQYVSTLLCCQLIQLHCFFFSFFLCESLFPPAHSLYQQSEYMWDSSEISQNSLLTALDILAPFVPRDIGHVPPPLQPHLFLHRWRMKSPSERKNTVH